MYEIDRIVNLPVVLPMSKEKEEDFNKEHLYLTAYNAGFRFTSPQANAIKAYETYGGGFFPIGVGWGKTLITLAISNIAYNKGIDRIFLCIPTQVSLQLLKRDIPWARSRIPLSVPIHSFAGLNRSQRKRILEENRLGLYIVPYSHLSVPDAKDILYGLNPGLIIADECHHLRNHNAARTRRVFHFVKKKEQTQQFVALSGTITNRSILDYWWLAVASLRYNCPLPLLWTDILQWSRLLDSNSVASDYHRFNPLKKWCKEYFPYLKIPPANDGCRILYRQRLRTSPGVIFNVDQELGCSLLIENRKPKKPGKELLDLVKDLTTKWVNPEGEDLAYAIQVAQYMYELSAGFYHIRKWPDNVDKKSIERESVRKELNKAISEYIRSGNRDFDTPFLLVGAIKSDNKKIPKYIKNLYHKLHSFTSYMKRITGEPVRVDDFKIKQAAEWCKKESGGIVWYYSIEVGKWLEEVCNATLVTKETEEEFLDPRKKERCFIASWPKHGTGKNLQYGFHKNFFVQWPRSAKDAEQVLGRTHRLGQEEDEVLVCTNHYFNHDFWGFAATLNDAVYIDLSTGDRQKILYAEYNPLPALYKSKVLRSQGYEVKDIDFEQLRRKVSDGSF